MLCLLRADLFRAFGAPRLRGWALPVAAAVAVYSLLSVGITWFVGSDLYVELARAMGSTETYESLGATAALASPVALWSSSFAGSGMLGLAACFSMAWPQVLDTRDGFAKSLCAGLASRVPLLVERCLFAGIVSLVYLLVGVAFSSVPAAMLGLSVGPGDPLACLAWLGLLWVATWAMAVVTLALCWFFRKTMPTCYITAFLVASASLPQLINALGYAGPGALFSFLAPLQPQLFTASQWFSSMVYKNVCLGMEALTLPAWGLVDVPGGFVGQALLACALWGAVCVAVMVWRGRRSDLA